MICSLLPVQRLTIDGCSLSSEKLMEAFTVAPVSSTLLHLDLSEITMRTAAETTFVCFQQLHSLALEHKYASDFTSMLQRLLAARLPTLRQLQLRVVRFSGLSVADLSALLVALPLLHVTVDYRMALRSGYPLKPEEQAQVAALAPRVTVLV